jgi:hypothetical protein
MPTNYRGQESKLDYWSSYQGKTFEFGTAVPVDDPSRHQLDNAFLPMVIPSQLTKKHP